MEILKTEFMSYRVDYSIQANDAKDAQEHNKQVSMHNARVDALIDQKNDFSVRQQCQ